MTKRRFMYNIAEIIQRYQITPYEEREGGPPPSPRSAPLQSPSTASSHMANINAFLTFLYRMPILSDKQLYPLSHSNRGRIAALPTRTTQVTDRSGTSRLPAFLFCRPITPE